MMLVVFGRISYPNVPQKLIFFTSSDDLIIIYQLSIFNTMDKLILKLHERTSTPS